MTVRGFCWWSTNWSEDWRNDWNETRIRKTFWNPPVGKMSGNSPGHRPQWAHYCICMVVADINWWRTAASQWAKPILWGMAFTWQMTGRRAHFQLSPTGENFVNIFVSTWKAQCKVRLLLCCMFMIVWKCQIFITWFMQFFFRNVLGYWTFLCLRPPCRCNSGPIEGEVRDCYLTFYPQGDSRKFSLSLFHSSHFFNLQSLQFLAFELHAVKTRL